VREAAGWLRAALREFRHPWVPALLLSVLPFFLVPDLDVAISRALAGDGEFPWGRSEAIQLLWRIVPPLGWLALAVLLALLALGPFVPRLRRVRTLLAFLVCTLLLGPGLVVNVILKDHGFGRPRPGQIQQFGGDAAYAPVLVHSEACSHNCSFPSGHAAFGFWLVSFAWVFRRRSWFAIGVCAGGLLGLARMLQGGHFASDVVLSFWIVFGVSYLLARPFGLDVPLGAGAR
jgi:lipid A 4'-phosphatase